VLILCNCLLCRGSRLTLDSLATFSSSVIYRLDVDLSNEVTRTKLLQNLHVVWVLNEDFIKSEEISAVTDGGSGGGGQQNWFFGRAINEREKDAIDILNNHLPCKQQFSNPFRLDMVLEDYLQQARVHNSQDMVGQGVGWKKPMPEVRVECVLSLPHGSRLDLSVLLTASILFEVPEELFVETLKMLLLPLGATEQEVRDLADLPVFAKTGVINLIRRMCRREQSELEQYGHCLPAPFARYNGGQAAHKSLLKKVKEAATAAGKATSGNALDNKFVVETVTPDLLRAPPTLPPPDAQCFRFLKTVRAYLSSALPNRGLLSASEQAAGSGSRRSAPFNDMELDLLHHLPDIVTIATCPPTGSPAYREWVSLAARHSVVLMTRCPSCPPLTGSQRSKAHSDMLKLLRPLLVAAEMTYEDLEIVTTGPAIDGRTQAPEKVLGFGSGVPTGQPKHLVWHGGVSKERNYAKPWAEGATSATAKGGELTEGFAVKPSRGNSTTPGVAADMCDEESADAVDSIRAIQLSTARSTASGKGRHCTIVTIAMYCPLNGNFKFITIFRFISLYLHFLFCSCRDRII
jgi:hypothetical protein